jgi:hypothetical protein
VARLYLPTRSSEAPLQYSLAPVADAEALTLGPAVTPDARAETSLTAASYLAGRRSGRRTHGPITRLTGGRI